MSNLSYTKKISFICVIIITCIAFFCSNSYSQHVNYNFNNFSKINPKDSSSLHFRIENINFFKNNEYHSDITKGYTLIGGQIKPQFAFYINPRLRLNVGANILKYSGQDKINKASLLLSAIYKPSRNFSIIMGSLNNNNNHGLPEFLASGERYFSSKFENGLQILYKGDRLELDTWVDWDVFIEKDDPIQERFSFNISSRYFLNKKDSDNIFSIPIYLAINHMGGEIDLSENNVATYGNFASGLEYKKRTGASCIKSIGGRLLFSTFRDYKKNVVDQFNRGHAIYSTIKTETSIGDFIAGYWQSKDYFSLHGLDIFHSVSSFDAELYEKNRKLVNLKYIFRYSIGKESSIVLALEDYFDIENKENNISASIFLIINTNIFIKKLKK